LLREVQIHVENLHKAINAIEKNEQLKKILRLILRMGNFMNSNTKNGNARGFKLGTLKKLRDLRSTTDPKTTLLHLLVESVESKLGDCLDFYEELSVLSDASNMPVSNIGSELGSLARRMGALAKSLDREPDASELSFFPPLKKFCEQQSAILEKLKQEFEGLEVHCRDVIKEWGNDPKMAPEEFIGEILFFANDFKKAKDEIKSRKISEEKRKAAQEKGSVLKSSTVNAPTGSGIGRRMPPGAKPLDGLFMSMNLGNIKLRQTAPA
jgi:hypothetical protein